MIFFILILALSDAAGAAVEHPFLIVKESDYPALQEKATQSPWITWSSAALNKYAATYPTNGTINQRAESLRDIAGANALLYILNPSGRATYKANFIAAMNNWDNLIELANDIDNNANCVYTGTAFFESVLALDIFYNDLTTAERSVIENKLEQYLTTKLNGNNWLDQCSWTQNTYAAKGIWALYKGYDATSNLTSYQSQMYASISSSGVYEGGGSYAGLRMDHSLKETKGYFLDVIEFTNSGTFRYYNDTTLKNFYEWLYGYSITPSKKQTFIFGDAYPNSAHISYPGAAPYRAYRFSPEAAGYAAWSRSGSHSITTSGFLNYVLAGRSFPAQLKPVSRVFPSGGAWFTEGSSATTSSLGGALWNIKSSESHTHYETNALALAAYGETVLRNLGAAYGRLSPAELKISEYNRTHTAELGNTVLIEGINHTSALGGGITEWITAPLFDYASGDSGNALPNGKHIRNFVFVHPQDGLNGYWVVFDEVTSASGNTANVIMHPNSDSFVKVSDKTEYRWLINKDLAYSGSKVNVSVFLGTPPTLAVIKDGIMATDINYNFKSKYLYSTYGLVSNKKNIVTVLFPSDPTHSKAAMNRISGSGYSGASIDLGSSVTDVSLESSGAGAVTYNGVSFNGPAVWYRSNSGVISSYFVRNGTLFSDAGQGYGFSSSKNITVYMKGTSGNIISPGAEITFYYPDVQSVKIDGVQVNPLGIGVNRIKVSVTPGAHTLELAVGETATVTAPVFSPIPGTYDTEQSVTISSLSDGAAIRYTTDGTTPTETSAEYSTPIKISETTTIKAGSWITGFKPSAISTAKYNISKELPFKRAMTVNEWGDQFSSKEKIDQVINNLSYMNVDLMVMSVGSEYFEAVRDPSKASWDSRASWNMLEYAIEKAHSMNIQLHLNIAVNIAGLPTRAERRLWGDTYNVVLSNGSKNDVRLDPSYTIVQDYEAGLLGFIAKNYPTLDGIHIEEPFYDIQSYSLPIVERVKAKYGGYDIIGKSDWSKVECRGSSMKGTNHTVCPTFAKIYDVERDVFNEFFSKIRAAVNTNKSNPGLLLSANAHDRYRPLHGFDPGYMSDNYLLDWYAAQISVKTLPEFKSAMMNLNQTVDDIPVVPFTYITYTSIFPDSNPAFMEQVNNTCEYGGDAEWIFAYAWRNKDNASWSYHPAYEGMHSILPSRLCGKNYNTTPVLNMIENPGFESGTTSWSFFTSGIGTFGTISPGFRGSNAARLTLNSSGTNIQLQQTGITLEPNTRYRLSFAAYSPAGNDVAVNLIKHGPPYTGYGLAYTADLGTDWQTFMNEFNTSNLTGIVNDGRLMFWFSPFAEAGDTYYIDDVRLEKVAPGNIRYDLNKDGAVDIHDFLIIFIHFNETTTFPYPDYDINTDGQVDIFDLILVANNIK